MKDRKLLKVSVIIFFGLLMITGCKNTKNIQPPDAMKKPKELTIHGDTRIDNYYWLNDRENPEVIEYLEAENRYTESVLKPTEDLQEKLFDEMKSRIKETDQSVPYFYNGYYYYSRYEEGKEYPIYCRKKGTLDAKEEIMLNVNEMTEGDDFYQISGVVVSPDSKLLAYGVDTVSRRKYTIYVKNLETGELLSEKIPVTTGSVAWANDGKTFFYTRKDDGTLRSNKIFKHILGNDFTSDEEIYYEEDETFRTNIYKSKSQKYLIIASSS